MSSCLRASEDGWVPRAAVKPAPLPIDEGDVVEAIADLIEMESAGECERATVSLGPYTAYVLIAVLQLSWRHPDLSDHHKKMIEDIARPLATLFGPPLAASIELGWDPAFDQPSGNSL
jgi:hypothetical protein